MQNQANLGSGVQGLKNFEQQVPLASIKSTALVSQKGDLIYIYIYIYILYRIMNYVGLLEVQEHVRNVRTYIL